MRKNSELRATARQKLKGNWGATVMFSLVYFICVAIAYSFWDETEPKNNLAYIIVSIFVLYPLMFGVYKSFLEFYRGDASQMIGKMFSVFGNNYLRALFVPLLTVIYTFLWTLLFIIPGIIKSLSYSMTYFIAHDHPELGANECIERSMKMMHGYKMRLFLLYLSFIGWFFLSCLTLGIGFLFLYPYTFVSLTAFYEELKKNQEEEIIDVV